MFKEIKNPTFAVTQFLIPISDNIPHPSRSFFQSQPNQNSFNLTKLLRL